METILFCAVAALALTAFYWHSELKRARAVSDALSVRLVQVLMDEAARERALESFNFSFNSSLYSIASPDKPDSPSHD